MTALARIHHRPLSAIPLEDATAFLAGMMHPEFDLATAARTLEPSCRTVLLLIVVPKAGANNVRRGQNTLQVASHPAIQVHDCDWRNCPA